jgi:hypothetical protein
MKTTSYPNTPLAKLIPSFVACVVIASLSITLSATLSASATANQVEPNAKTPAQVEQALTALLNSRDANIQLASYTSTPPSNSINNLVARQAPVDARDHSQKSIAELVLAGLVITNAVKDELSSPVTLSEVTLSEVTSPPRDYAVADIVSVEELDTATNGDVNSIIEKQKTIHSDTQEAVLNEAVLGEIALGEVALDEAVLAEAVSNEAEAKVDAYEESAGLIADTSQFRPIEETVNEASENAFRGLTAANVKELNKETEIAETEVIETQIAEIEIAKTEVVETQIAKIEIAETEVVETQIADIEIAETEVVETQIADIEIAETEVVETQIAEIEVLETEVVETEIADIEIAETEVVEAQIAEIEIAETAVTPTEIFESQPQGLLAKVSTAYTSTSQGINTNTPMTNSETSKAADNIGANVNVSVRSEACPENFNQVSIPANGKMCQIFAADFPASMILFIPQTPEEVIQYYLASSNSFVKPKRIKQRTMLKSADNNTTLIISKDGGGTQVDILVKSPVS